MVNTAEKRCDGCAMHIAKIESLERRVLFDAVGVDNLDPTWGGSGTVQVADNLTPADIFAQSDGKIIVVGFDTGPADIPSAYIIGQATLAIFRFNHDGSPDNSFGTAGETKLPLAASSLVGAGVTSDGNVEVVLSGTVRSLGNDAEIDQTKILRFSASGRADPHFGHDGVVALPKVRWQPFSNARWQPRVAQIASDGAITMAGVYDVKVHGSDATKLAFAQTQTFIKVAQFNSSGHLSGSFGDHGTKKVFLSNDEITSLRIEPAGSILLSAESLSVEQEAVVRLTPHGHFDQSFGNHGTVLLTGPSYPLAVALPMPSGNVLFKIGAYAKKLTAEGNVDTQFDKAAIPFSENQVIDVSADGQILVISSDNNQITLQRFSSSGALIDMQSTPDVPLGSQSPSVGVDDALMVGGDRTYVVERISQSVAPAITLNALNIQAFVAPH